MPIQSDISFYLSGGRSNRDPLLSLGGDMSTVKISKGTNNLFDDITRPQVEAGYTDYRCIYVKNTSNTLWKNVKIYMKSQGPNGAFGWIGVQLADDFQQFNVISSHGAQGGYFNVRIGSTTGIRVDYNSSLSTWAANFRTAILSAGFTDVVVNATYYPNLTTPPYFTNKTFQVFQIRFQGEDGKRNQPLIEADGNHLTAATSDVIILNSSKLISGSPSNTVAKQIPSKTTPPDDISFLETTRDAPISIGNLKPEEVVPIWIKRSVEPSQEEIQSDNFVVALRGDAVF